MCEHCEGFALTVRVNTPREYFDLLRQIMHIMDQGTFRHVSGSCSLAELVSSRTWPSDVISQRFACSHCGLLFDLVVDTYHGSGGCWLPLPGQSNPSIC